jgi:hypothetical protein
MLVQRDLAATLAAIANRARGALREAGRRKLVKAIPMAAS